MEKQENKTTIGVLMKEALDAVPENVLEIKQLQPEDDSIKLKVKLVRYRKTTDCNLGEK